MNKPQIAQIELAKAYHEHKYVIAGRKIYQIDWSQNTGDFIYRSIYKHDGALPLTKSGRYFMQTAEYINDLLDFKL